MDGARCVHSSAGQVRPADGDLRDAADAASRARDSSYGDTYLQAVLAAQTGRRRHRAHAPGRAPDERTDQ